MQKQIVMGLLIGVKMSAHYCGPVMNREQLDGDRGGGLEHPRAKEVLESCRRLLDDVFPHLQKEPS